MALENWASVTLPNAQPFVHAGQIYLHAKSEG